MHFELVESHIRSPHSPFRNLKNMMCFPVYLLNDLQTGERNPLKRSQSPWQYPVHKAM